MKIGIIGAMESEITHLREALLEPKTIVEYKLKFYTGKLGRHEVVIVQAGIGKVNATIGVTLLKQLFNVGVLINTGVAGALDKGLKIGDIVIAHSLMHHDVDVTAFGYEPGQMAAMPVKYYPDSQLLRAAQTVCRKMDIEPVVGQIVSGDQFINHQSSIAEILNKYPTARAVEMESAAIAQAAHVLNIPFLIMRSISDGSDSEATIVYDQFVEMAGEISARIVLSMMQQI